MISDKNFEATTFEISFFFLDLGFPPNQLKIVQGSGSRLFFMFIMCLVLFGAVRQTELSLTCSVR